MIELTKIPPDIYSLTNSLPLDQITLIELMDTLRENKEDFAKQLETFFSGKYLDWISIQFLETEDVMQMYRHVKNLAYLYETSFSENDEKSLREIERGLRRLEKQYTIDLILTKHLEDSKEYEIKKDLIEEITESLGDLFHHVENNILTRNRAIAELRLIQDSKKAIIEAISKAGGQLNIGGSSSEIQAYQQELESEEDNLVSFIRDPSFQPSQSVFWRNQEKRRRESKEKGLEDKK